MTTVAGLTKQMFMTMVCGGWGFGTLMPVFDRPHRFSDYTRKLPEVGEDGATHILRKDWVFDTEVYRKGTRVIARRGSQRIRFLGVRIHEGKVCYE